MSLRAALVRWVHNTRYESVKRAALRYAGPDRTALDYGCGDGHLVRELGPHFGFVAGAEIDAKKVDAAHYLGVPGNGWVGQVDELNTIVDKHTKGGFDVITLSQVVEHVPDRVRDTIFDNIRLLSHADTILIVEVPIESGPIIAIKAIARPVIYKMTGKVYVSPQYTIKEVLQRLSIKHAPHIRNPADYYSHKDFSVWNLHQYLQQRYTIELLEFSPINALRWLNCEVIFTRRWK